MTDRPIIFSAPMVRALLDGRKTQTRRIIPQHSTGPWDLRWQSGDRLWVRETWKPHSIYDRHKPSEMPPTGKTFYAADEKYAPSNTGWKPSIHMPRWASRLTLIVEAVRVQRLQDISEADALAEGIEKIEDAGAWRCYQPKPSRQDAWICPRESFRTLWESINGPGSWEVNPYVAAITFRVIAANIDATAAKGE